MEPKIGHKIALGTLCLIILIFIVGMVYVYYSDQSSSQISSKTSSISYRPLPTPPPTNPNSQEGVSIDSISTPIQAGSNALISAQTNSGSVCTIMITQSQTNGVNIFSLKPTKANIYGLAEWNWLVNKTTPIGIYPVKITCTFNKKVAVVDDTIQITAATN